jgi:UDP-N-acetylglucosamine 2-epimerase (non-hydrolysing)
MKVAVIASTRPEVIKLSPIFGTLKKQGIDHVFATTGQHYDLLLFKKFIEELGLDEPDHDISVGSGTQATQTGKAMIGIEEMLIKESPDVVVVEGDTNSVLSGALASIKLKIPVAHVEAGLRSYDRTMPEEINRVLTDHCSELCFAPTETSALNLVNEGINPKKIHIVGNTIVDATLSNIKQALKNSKIHEDYSEKFILLTLHRQENTDDVERLESIFSALRDSEKDILFPMHPRTSKIIRGTSLGRLLEGGNIRVTPPLGYLDFLALMKRAFAVLTDSGGVQEEAITLGTPCLTLRYNTERPESVWAGGNILVGTKREDILEKINHLSDPMVHKKMKSAKNPFGDGKAGERIVKILTEKYSGGELNVESSDTRDGYFYISILQVDKKLAGKKVKDSGYEIFKIIEEGVERFPYPESVLIKGQLIEVLKKG